MTIPLWRRLLLAAVATGLSAIAFHGSLASALVTRGDDAMRAGDAQRAFVYYNRALTLAPGSRVAADRLAFHLLQRNSAGDARYAIAVASRALERCADDAALLLDRAIALQRLQRWRGAERDFSLAATLTHDPRYEQFAGRAALHFGDRTRAIAHFRSALADDATFGPARSALKEMRG
ncbi:MAG: hypothetical protein NVSMB5_06200 [Candidatus Velthaea sp.]